MSKISTYKLPDMLVPFDEPLVRLGNKHDGGYLISPIGIESNTLLNFGVGDDWGFELDYIQLNNYGAVHSYDGTIDVKSFPRSKLKTFYNLYRKHRTFYNENITKDNIERVFGNNRNIFLKCDIEGAEYDIIENITNNDHINQLVIEFHWLVSENKLPQFMNFIEKMSAKYNLIHIHANNWSHNDNYDFADVVEVTMLKKDLCTSTIKRNPVYHKLDSPCNGLGDIEIVLEI